MILNDVQWISNPLFNFSVIDLPDFQNRICNLSNGTESD